MQGPIIESQTGKVVGVWSITLGNLFVTTEDSELKKVLKKGIPRTKPELKDGKIYFKTKNIPIADATLTELAAAVAPDFICVKEKVIERDTADLSQEKLFKPKKLQAAQRGYIVRGSKVEGAWYSTPNGIRTTTKTNQEKLTTSKPIKERIVFERHIGVIIKEPQKTLEQKTLGELMLSTKESILPYWAVEES